jgi:hypothetical protein
VSLGKITMLLWKSARRVSDVQPDNIGIVLSLLSATLSSTSVSSSATEGGSFMILLLYALMSWIDGRDPMLSAGYGPSQNMMGVVVSSPMFFAFFTSMHLVRQKSAREPDANSVVANKITLVTIATQGQGFSFAHDVPCVPRYVSPRATTCHSSMHGMPFMNFQ